MQQSEGLTRAISRVLSKYPLFAIPMLQLCDVTEDRSIPTAATNGKRIRINPDWFNAKSSDKGLTTIEERCFVLCHEAAHVMCDHPRRMRQFTKQIIGPDGKQFDPRRYNKAGDYWINKMLEEADVGKFPEFGGIIDRNLDTNLTVDEIYKNLKEEEDDGEQGQPGQPGENFDTHDPADDDTPLPSEQELSDAIQQAVSVAKQAGNLPGNWGREFDKLLNPKKPWEDILRSKLINAIGVEEYTFAKLNRKMIVMPPHMIAPSTTGYSSTAVYVLIDISGSVSTEEFTRFMSEVAGILTSAKPIATRLEFWDTQSHGRFDIDEYGELEKHMKPEGGHGGTDMQAAFFTKETREFFSEHEDTVAVCLTDGYTTSDEQPPFHVIWCTTGSTDFGYGEVIEVDI